MMPVVDDVDQRFVRSFVNVVIFKTNAISACIVLADASWHSPSIICKLNVYQTPLSFVGYPWQIGVAWKTRPRWRPRSAG